MNNLSSFHHLCYLINELDNFSVTLYKGDEEAETIYLTSDIWNRYRSERVYGCADGNSYTHQQLIKHMINNIPGGITSIKIHDADNDETFITDHHFIETLEDWRKFVSKIKNKKMGI